MKLQKNTHAFITAIIILGIIVGAVTGSFLFLRKAPPAHAATTQHYFYVFSIGTMYVFDMDNGNKLVNTVSLPIKDAFLRPYWGISRSRIIHPALRLL
ncbi:MAG TPA: hypothetical protein VL485_24280 [Ktedonobacteraceae bacterium]|jgi:hypothetical protein|nr:hypothetical protein [Ktedonobacteraceae bacterium]